jgi:SprT protein
MPKKECSLTQLQQWLPEGSLDAVLYYLQQYKVHLTITQERVSVLGDYRNAHAGRNHRISVNGNLNSFSFLITLLHELAHLLTFERYGHRVMAHGTEWKNEYSQLLSGFMDKGIFPEDIHQALRRSLTNPAASSCADEVLMRVLQRYDPPKAGVLLVEALPEGSLFSIKGNRIFRRLERVRKRIRCEEVSTGKIYLFSAIYEVAQIEG